MRSGHADDILNGQDLGRIPLQLFVSDINSHIIPTYYAGDDWQRMTFAPIHAVAR